MKRGAFAVGSFVMLGVIPIGTAMSAPQGGGLAGALSKASAVYYKPSPGGTDTTAYVNNRIAATVSCRGDSQPANNFVIVIGGGQAHCRNAFADVNTSAVLCPGGGSLVTDDKFPPAIRTAFGQADACLQPGAPADATASYATPVCGTNSTGSGFIRQLKAGADTCEKVINRMRLQTPGDNGGVLTLSTVIGAGKQVVPTQAQIDSKSVKCPANATLEQVGNGVLCKKN